VTVTVIDLVSASNTQMPRIYPKESILHGYFFLDEPELVTSALMNRSWLFFSWRVFFLSLELTDSQLPSQIANWREGVEDLRKAQVDILLSVSHSSF
jgi:hypothetical protein